MRDQEHLARGFLQIEGLALRAAKATAGGGDHHGSSGVATRGNDGFGAGRGY